MTDYLELAKSVVNKASADGAEAEVIITNSKDTEAKVRGGEISQLSISGSKGMGVRVIKEGQTGYAYTSDLSDEGIEETWQTATQLARVTTADEYRKLPELQNVPDEDLGIFDPNFMNVPTEDKLDLLKQVEQAALDYDEKIALTDFCTYGDSLSYTYLANSKGFAGEYGKTVAYAFLMAIARDSDGNSVNAFGMGAGTSFSDLNADDIGRQAGRKALSILGGKPIPTQRATVVLDQVVGGQILSAISQALSADAWQRKRSFLMDRMNQEVGSSMVTLMDNGRLKGGLASAPFDGEGVPTQATRLIDEGVLQNLIYDSYSAAKDGTISTGNATRSGHRGMPSLGATNFYMQPGNKSADDIIKGVEKGFYVLSVMQTGGVDSVTGDCSMSANGLWIENGEIQQAVGGVTIATTLDDFLMNVSDVGDDLMQLPFFGSIGVPTLCIDNVMIGGVDS